MANNYSSAKNWGNTFLFAFAKVGTLPQAKKLCPRNQQNGFLLGLAGGAAAAGLGMDSSGP